MKKALALILALVMVLALAACGEDAAKKDDDNDDPTTSTTAPVADPTDPTDPPVNKPTEPSDPPVDKPTEPSLAEQIVGDWTTVVKMTGSMINLPDFAGYLELKIDYTLRADGTGYAVMDKDAFDASVDANHQALVDAMVQLLYQQLGGKEAAESAVQAQFNQSCAEYAQVFPQSLKSTVSIPKVEGSWSVEGNELTMGESKVTVTLDGDTMTWTGETTLESLGINSLVFVRA